MSSIDTAIQWYQAKQAASITYSMAERYGPNSYDCSSAGYYALEAAGLLPSDLRIGNTDSMFGDLEQHGWIQVQADANGNFPTQRGDVAIWGKRGASSGSFGHFMLFIDANNVIHCNSYYNGIHVNNYDNLAKANGWPEATFYHYTGSVAAPAPSASNTDQSLQIGSTIKFTKTYTANDVQQIGGIWQVRTDELCPAGFTWADNGIPTNPLVAVDAEGFATADQKLNAGSLYVIPGKFSVLDLGQFGSVWLAQVSWNGLKFWIDVESATEILGSDAGTPAPGQHPAPIAPIVPAPVPAPSDPVPVVVVPPVPTTPIETPIPDVPKVTTLNPKEDPMSFTKTDQPQLNPIEPVQPQVPATPTEASKSAGLFVTRIASQVSAAAIITQGGNAILQQQVGISLSGQAIGWSTIVLAVLFIFWGQWGYKIASTHWASNLKWPF
jgi:hypothetical protein